MKSLANAQGVIIDALLSSATSKVIALEERIFKKNQNSQRMADGFSSEANWLLKRITLNLRGNKPFRAWYSAIIAEWVLFPVASNGLLGKGKFSKDCRAFYLQGNQRDWLDFEASSQWLNQTD